MLVKTIYLKCCAIILNVTLAILYDITITLEICK